MGAASSNLAACGYDMVCAVTQKAINNTLKPYLAALDLGEFSACYWSGSGGPPVKRSLADVAAAIGGDPFAFSGSPDDLAGQGFVFAFRARPGLPAGMPRAHYPDIVVLDQGPSKIRHQLCLAEFEFVAPVMKVGANGLYTGEIEMVHFRQDPANPLLFSSAVALALGDIDRSALPPDLQASLAALPAGMAFSIKQLFLDLGGSTPIGCSYAGNSGAAPSWCTADVVARVLDEYWLNMPARARAIGYGVTAPSGPTPSLTPTAIGFVVSPHLDSNGAPSGKLAFNTLDYLVMTGSDPLPAAAAPFAWNWVEDVEDPPSGVIAVRRETFLQSLATVLDSITAPLCYQVSRTDDGTPTLSQSASPGQWRLPPPPADPAINMVFISSFGSDPTLEYTPGMPWIGARWQIKLGLGYQCSGGVSYTLPRTLNCWLYARMQADDGTPESDNSTAAFVDFMVQVPFTLQAGGTGRLTAQAGASTTTDNSTPLADDFPYKAQLTAMLDSQRTTIPAAVQGAADSLSVLLAGTGAFVFPAGQTFIAKDPILSDQFDLVVEVTYDQPHPAHDPS